LMSDCSLGVGVGGYVAAIEWRSVQVLRPSTSTSGGQSFAGGGATALRADLLWVVKDAKELQARHLEWKRRCQRGASTSSGRDSRFPVLAEDHAFRVLWRRRLSSGTCSSASRARRMGSLRFCAVGCHLSALRYRGN
jgi:hypothetical protein